MRMALITGGSSFQQGFLKVHGGKFGALFDKVLYLPRLHEESLDEFDCVVIATGLNPDFLMQNSKKIVSYLEQGGNVVAFGSVRPPYIPHISFQPCETNFWWWIHPGADLPLYAHDENHRLWNYLEVRECKWHYHGTFEVDEGCQKILVDEVGRPILYKDDCHFAGTLYVTSLDPDYHIGQGFMPTTVPFMEKFMQWVVSDIEAKLAQKESA